MKKIIIFLLTFIFCAFLISCGNHSTNSIEEGAEDLIEVTAPSSLSTDKKLIDDVTEPSQKTSGIKMTNADPPVITKELIVEENDIYKNEQEMSNEVEESYAPILENDYTYVAEDIGATISDGIPLDYDEQQLLANACEEFGVPYALALGLIEKETNFRNVTGDGGASFGYMQIQQRYHTERMERLGVTDLMDPDGNFRVGLDYLSELYDQYEDWGTALTAYNMGYDPGYLTNYAYAVLDNYDNWQAVINEE